MDGGERLGNDIHYWLGRLSMADEMIEEMSKYRTEWAKEKLKAIKRERAKVIKQIERLAR